METAKKYELKAVGTDSEFGMKTIREPKDAVDYAMGFYHEDINLYESAFIMMLNRSNKVTGWAKISQGGICETSVDIRLICKYALDTLASGVILVHNHPSGDPRPGQTDISLTRKLKGALNLLDIKLVDHVVITGEGGSYSFSDERLI